jgi:hypothetical protein
MLEFIPDGYDKEPGFIRAVAGVHKELRFTYRPCLPEEQSELLSHAKAETDAAFDRRCAAFVSARLRTWSLVDRTKTPPVAVEVTTKNVLRLRTHVFRRLYEVITGLGITDIDPDWSEEKQIEVADQQFESALTGKTPGEVAADAAAKN